MNKNEFTKTIEIKIVYYGCGMSGKTTSLKQLFKYFNRENQLTSIETTSGRTLFFDFGIIPIKGNDWTIKFLIYSATGQDFYASTRPATLMGTDGIIFIVDSQRKFWEDNRRSWNELIQFFGDQINQIPIIICLNKRDLPDLISKEFLIEGLNLNNFQNITIIETVAKIGKGVVDAFKSLLRLMFPSAIITNS